MLTLPILSYIFDDKSRGGYIMDLKNTQKSTETTFSESYQRGEFLWKDLLVIAPLSLFCMSPARPDSTGHEEREKLYNELLSLKQEGEVLNKRLGELEPKALEALQSQTDLVKQTANLLDQANVVRARIDAQDQELKRIGQGIVEAPSCLVLPTVETNFSHEHEVYKQRLTEFVEKTKADMESEAAAKLDLSNGTQPHETLKENIDPWKVEAMLHARHDGLLAQVKSIEIGIDSINGQNNLLKDILSKNGEAIQAAKERADKRDQYIKELKDRLLIKQQEIPATPERRVDSDGKGGGRSGRARFG